MTIMRNVPLRGTVDARGTVVVSSHDVFGMELYKRKFPFCFCFDNAYEIIERDVRYGDADGHEDALLPNNRDQPNPYCRFHVERPYPERASHAVRRKCRAEGAREEKPVAEEMHCYRNQPIERVVPREPPFRMRPERDHGGDRHEER